MGVLFVVARMRKVLLRTQITAVPAPWMPDFTTQDRHDDDREASVPLEIHVTVNLSSVGEGDGGAPRASNTADGDAGEANLLRAGLTIHPQAFLEGASNTVL